jgi:lipopolysaccharide/colanic/teichoic acid biosynthesis glycosyltransferase
VLKRLVDIFLGFLLAMLSLPLLMLAALLIKIDSRGPVLFSQPRMGRGFRPFRIYKLRTMAVEQSGSSVTLGADPRITRIGAVLRKLRVDELPQLWNVLKGEMSLVGPRPVVCELAHQFEDHYRRLCETRPGLTDPATLRYADEVERMMCVPDPALYFQMVLMPRKLRLSRFYQERATLLADLGVLLGTAALIAGTCLMSLRNLIMIAPFREPVREGN